MAIEDWMPNLKNALGGITGVEQVHGYDDLPAVIRVTPCFVVLPLRGTFNYSSGGPNIGVHTLQATLYVSAQVLPESYSLAIPFIGRLVRQMAANVKLGGLIEHWGPTPDFPLYEGPGSVEYGADSQGAPIKLLGIIFRFEVKEIETYTVSA